MTKQELIEENKKLLEKVEKMEEEINHNFLLNENSTLYQIRDLLKEQIYFYQEILRNLTNKEGENNEI